MQFVMNNAAKYQEIGNRIRAAMAEAGIKSSASLARMLNQEPSRVRNWTNGTSRPPPEWADKLAGLLRVPADWIYYGRDEYLTHGKFMQLAARMQSDNHTH